MHTSLLSRDGPFKQIGLHVKDQEDVRNVEVGCVMGWSWSGVEWCAVLLIPRGVEVV